MTLKFSRFIFIFLICFTTAPFSNQSWAMPRDVVPTENVKPGQKIFTIDARAKRMILKGNLRKAFPTDWSDEKVLDQISTYAADPSTGSWSLPDQRGYIVKNAQSGDVTIRIIYDTKRGKIVKAALINVR